MKVLTRKLLLLALHEIVNKQTRYTAILLLFIYLTNGKLANFWASLILFCIFYE